MTYKVKRIVIISILFIGLGLNAFGGSKIYKSPFFGFTAEYPESWNASDVSGIVFFRSPQKSLTDTFSENVNIVVEDISQNPMSLVQYADNSVMTATEALPHFRLLQRGRAKIGAIDALYYVFSSQQGDWLLKHKVYMFIVNGLAYNITYTAEEHSYDVHLLEAEAIMHSFKITR